MIMKSACTLMLLGHVLLSSIALRVCFVCLRVCVFVVVLGLDLRLLLVMLC